MGSGSSRRTTLAALVAAGAIAACARDVPSVHAPLREPADPGTGDLATVRYVHSAIDDAFWVTKGGDVDRVVSSGARLELGPGGVILGAAWETDLATKGDPLVGGLAVPARLGGGFVFWSRVRLFRAPELTAPLEPIAMATSEVVVRGARAGLESVLVFTEAGAHEIDLRAAHPRLGPASRPALLDAAALDGRRAADLDLFGRPRVTVDGGARWIDLAPSAGAARRLSVGTSDLLFDLYRGRVVVGPDARLEPVDAHDRAEGYDRGKPFETWWPPRPPGQESPFASLGVAPLSVAVAAGAPVGDGTAFAMSANTLARVEIATGKVVSSIDDWVPLGLACQPVRAPDAVLFACVWERSQGYGAYVLRSTDGAAPELERAFTDDGTFVADDEGALGFMGSCSAAPRIVDKSDPTRLDADAPIPPVLCVRAGRGVWEERRADLDEGTTLAGWAPRLDGRAAAIELAGEDVAPIAGAPRVAAQPGVTLLRVFGDPARFKRPSVLNVAVGLTGYVDKRFRLRDDGSIDAWTSPTDSSTLGVADVSFDPAGLPTVHDVPIGALESVAIGDHALVRTRDQRLHESTDHGRTWHARGLAPAPLSASTTSACTSLGCVLGPIVRVGWGDAALEPRVIADAPPPEPIRAPRLACTARGAPTPLVAPHPARGSSTRAWSDSLAISITPSADAAEPAPARPARPRHRHGRRSAPPPPPTPAVPLGVKRTVTLREPFAPVRGPRVIAGIDARFESPTRVMPLLSPSGEVDLLLVNESNEILVAGDRATFLPLEEDRRARLDLTVTTGVSSSAGHALTLAELRHRLAIEDDGPSPAPPLYVADDRPTDRPLAIARREDGALGVLVTDGDFLGAAGVAPIDRVAGVVREVAPLAAWSTARTADDPRCKEPDPKAWRALLLIQGPSWLEIDASMLPGFKLAGQALALVRWGERGVCIEGLDATVQDDRRGGDTSRAWIFAARWGGGRDQGAAFRAPDLRLDVSCRVDAP